MIVPVFHISERVLAFYSSLQSSSKFVRVSLRRLTTTELPMSM